MKIKSNYQDLLKVITIFCMFSDHLGLYFFPDYPLMRVIGRPVIAMFCFFAGYNFKHEPRLEILVLGLLMQIVSYAIFQQLVIDSLLIPIYLGQCYLWLFKERLNTFNRAYWHVIILGFIAPFVWDYSSYGTYVIAIMVLGYMAKRDASTFKITAGVSILLSMTFGLVMFPFSNFYIAALVAISLLQYLLLIATDLRTPLGFNINWISRNALYIYFIHLLVIQFVWIYLLMLPA